ncbi:hypothetical protein [Rudanella lutea]|uniref:hypothetical protein n=1 Tax=Rudanella lutea TaxID=451374 RepID=UPI00037802C4|nr:hypothetical protein [Rudanella lutea]
MHHYYKNIILLCVLLGPVLTTGQAIKPVQTNDFSFNAFKLPPFPVEVLHVGPAFGGVAFTTLMPIAGRTLPLAETPKPKGALFPSNALYMQTLVMDPSGQPVAPAEGGASPGEVFGGAPQPGAGHDWAVFGTNSNDGPLRLPYGGDFSQITNRFPQASLPGAIPLAPRLVSNGVGTASTLHITYPQQSLSIDPTTGKLVMRPESPATGAADIQAKTGGYALPFWLKDGHMLSLSNGHYEALALRQDATDKNIPFRHFQFLRFDRSGTLLSDQPVRFAYNREFFARCPLFDEQGNVVGSVNVFGDGSGKKADLDPDDNRVAVVVTDENGGIWAHTQPIHCP